MDMSFPVFSVTFGQCQEIQQEKTSYNKASSHLWSKPSPALEYLSKNVLGRNQFVWFLTQFLHDNKVCIFCTPL